MDIDPHAPAGELILHLSEEDLARWDRHYKETATPVAQKMRRLIVQYAREHGGLTLEYWRRSNGQWFGEPVMMGSAAIARELDVPVSDLEEIRVRTWTWLDPQLMEDPDFRAMRKRQQRDLT